jgi:thioredoxin 1
MIAPVLEQLAPVYQGQVVSAKINVDENRQVPERYGIRGIPTLLLFKNGQVAVNRVGALAASQLTAFLDDNLKETK